MAKFTPEDELKIARELSAVPASRDRSPIVARYASLYNCSRQAVYQAACRGGFTSGRRTRADLGRRRKPVPDAHLALLARMIHATHTEKDRIPLAADTAIFLAETQGLIPAGTVTPEYLNRWMRERSVAKADALRTAPSINLRSLHPNHLHQFDSSVCAQWYLDDNGTVRHQRRNFEVYKNKPGKSGPKVLRHLLVDHHTGAFFVWYAHSEATPDLLNFFFLAWARKSAIAELAPGTAAYLRHLDLDAQFPFRGVPRILLSDRGASLESDLTGRMLDALGVRHITHVPGNPRAKGSVEGMMYKIECFFEARLQGSNRATSLDQLNAWALDAAIQYQTQRAHTRHRLPRFDAWNAWITPETLREMPSWDLYRELAVVAPVTRRVRSDGTLSYRPEFRAAADGTPTAPNTYRVTNPNLIGSEVTVRANFYEYPAIRVTAQGIEEELLLAPVPRDEAGFMADAYAAVVGEEFTRHPFTDAQRSLGRLGATAPTPADRARIIAAAEPPAPPSPVHGRFTADGNAPAFLPRAGTTVELPAPSAPLTVSRFDARTRILDAMGASYGDLAPHQRDALDALPDRVAINDLAGLADAVRAGRSPQINQELAQ